MDKKYTSLEHTIRAIVTSPKQVDEGAGALLSLGSKIVSAGARYGTKAAKAAPVASAAIGTADGVSRAMDGDKTGAAISLGGAAASAIPGVGPIIGAAADAANLKRDLAGDSHGEKKFNKDNEPKKPEPTPAPTGATGITGKVRLKETITKVIKDKLADPQQVNEYAQTLKYVAPIVAPAMGNLTKTAPYAKTLTKTAVIAGAVGAATTTGDKNSENKNNISASASFDSEPRTAGNSKTLTTTKDIPKRRRKAVGESVNVVRRVIEEAKKKEKKGGKNPLVDLEPKLKSQELEQV